MQSVAETVVSEVESEYVVRSHLKRKKRYHYDDKPTDIVTESSVIDTNNSILHERILTPETGNWIAVGRNLRQIADDFHIYNVSNTPVSSGVFLTFFLCV